MQRWLFSICYKKIFYHCVSMFSIFLLWAVKCPAHVLRFVYLLIHLRFTNKYVCTRIWVCTYDRSLYYTPAQTRSRCQDSRALSNGRHDNTPAEHVFDSNAHVTRNISGQNQLMDERHAFWAVLCSVKSRHCTTNDEISSITDQATHVALNADWSPLCGLANGTQNRSA